MKTEIVRAEGLWADGSMGGLKDFSIVVFGGETIGITGLVDSGIASVSGILSGRSRIEKGTLYIHNEPAELKNIAQAHQRGIYTIEDRPILLKSLSLVENICIGEKNLRFGLSFPSREQKRKAEKVLKELNLPIDCRKPLSDMSLSDCHMIEIARACYMNGEVLVLDHIAGGYTRQELEQLNRLLICLKKRGMAVIVLDPSYERLAGMADTLAVMRSGRVEAVFDGGKWNREWVQKVQMGDYRIPDTRKTTFSQPQKTEPALLMERISGGGFEEFSFYLNKGEVLGFWDEDHGICSRLYDLLCGITQVKEGKAYLCGKPLQLSGGRMHMIRQGIGYVESREKGVFPKLTLAENLTIASLERFSRYSRINRKLEQAVVLDVAAQLGIPSRDLKKRIEKLDGNTRFLVTIYRWILKRSKVLILHNVLSESDLIIRDSMLRVINQIHSSQTGMILLSPNKKEIYELCDRVYLLKNCSLKFPPPIP